MNEDKLGPVARRLAATERVLSFEDEPDIAAFLRAYFRAAGYDFVHVDPEDPEEALKAVAEHRPDLIMLDLRLRGFSGLDIYRGVRDNPDNAFIPIVIVSAHADADPDFDTPGGLDGFVAKPFNTNTLADVVKERIEAARELANRGRDDTYDLMTQEYLSARLRDEMVLKAPFSFALVQLTTTEAITAEVGEDGRRYVINQLLTEARSSLAADVVFGATATDELAVLMPGRDTEAAVTELRPVLEKMAGGFSFPGGAQVAVGLAGGLATYPVHGNDVDPLFVAAELALADALDAGDALRVAM